MAADSFERLWKAVLLRCPLAGGPMAQDFVRWSFRAVVEQRKWSWLIKHSQFILPNLTSAGTVDVTNNSNAVVGHGTAWTAALIGQQFRVNLLTPIYTITAVGSATALTIDQVWGGTTQAGVGYRIYLAYVIVPADFHSFVSVYDPNFSWSLWTTVRQDELNMYDAQRASQGTPYVLADLDYTSIDLGGAAISPPLPRYEIWPHQPSAYVIPFLYESRPPDLDDSGATLPRYIPGNVILEGALAQCARWPGADNENKNPYYDLALSAMHQKAFTAMAGELAVQDDNVYGRDIFYEGGQNWPMAPLPFPVNSSYLQLHAI